MDQEEDPAEAGVAEATISESVLFAEFQQATDCIGLLSNANSEIKTRNEALAQIRQIFDKYLEFPSLLDRHVEPMVHQLTEAARSLLRSVDNFWESPLPHILSAIYALSKVRGRKRVQKFLSHEVDDVEVVLKALQSLEDNHQPTSSLEESSGPQHWESVYTLWSWMGILSLVPFNTSVVADATLISTLISLGKSHLNHAGPTREMAAACLASWLARPDLEKTELAQFIEWSRDTLETFIGEQRHIFRAMGALQTLVTILKVSTADRQRLVQLTTPLWEASLKISDSNPSNLLLRKYLVKWWTRLSCAYLPPRIAPWRYQRGRRSLKENIELASSKDAKEEESKDCTYKRGEDYDIFYVPDQVEEAMGHVISSLTDSATAVRWSAAKGVGRITERLPAICAEDVLDAILELFQDREKDHAWHGACLALAELARRGLLLPHRLGDVVPLIVQAIQYDVARRQSSVGAHVRDAACYTYWASARAYAPSVLKKYVPELSQSIVVAALFDREVNCRRAASAAFQEFVGRQGADNFKNGISILTAADYFTLGNRTDAYTTIALHVAQYEEYRRPMVEHLYQTKLSHWDPLIRDLTSKSLKGLTHLDTDYIATVVVPYLLENSLDVRDVQLRHGSVLGLAEIILAFGDLKPGDNDFGGLLSDQLLADIAELVPTIEKKRLYRGKGGEQMRAAVCRLIECISISRIPLTVPQQVRLLDSIDACIPHPSESIQEQAGKAVAALMHFYFPVGSKGPSDRLQKRVVDKYFKQLSTSTNPAATRGFALAFGYLPAKLLAPSTKVLETSLFALCQASRLDATVGNEKDAETRRNALTSLARMCETVGVYREPKDTECIVSVSTKQVNHVFKAFFLSLNDYNMERRGDVGSWSRIKAMEGLASLTIQTTKDLQRRGDYFDKEICTRMIGGLLKQLSEKLDVVRAHAGECLLRILTYSDPPIPHIPQRERLLEVLKLSDSESSLDQSINWSDASTTFPMVMEAAAIDEYFGYIISGIVISVGCLTESVSKNASRVLLQWAKDAKGTSAARNIGKVFLTLFEKHQREGRVILPLLKTIDLLISRVCIDELIQDVIFSRSLLQHLEEEEKECKDVHRLFAIINVSLGLLRGTGMEKDALRFVCKMLSHRFPRVRRFTAETFYIRLLESPELLGESNDSHPVLELLLNHPWDGDLEESKVKEMGARTAELLGLVEADEMPN